MKNKVLSNEKFKNKNFKFIVAPVHENYEGYCFGGCSTQCQGDCSTNCQGNCRGNH